MSESEDADGDGDGCLVAPYTLGSLVHGPMTATLSAPTRHVWSGRENTTDPVRPPLFVRR
jgi:hypothetical protein